MWRWKLYSLCTVHAADSLNTLTLKLSFIWCSVGCIWCCNPACFGKLRTCCATSAAEKRRRQVRAVNSPSERHPVAVRRPKCVLWALLYSIYVVTVACNSKALTRVKILLMFSLCIWTPHRVTVCESNDLVTTMDLLVFTFLWNAVQLSIKPPRHQPSQGFCVSSILDALVGCWGLATQLMWLAA